MTYKTGTIGEFASWTKRVVADPKAAKGQLKQWVDERKPTIPSREGGASPEALVKLLSQENLALLQVIGRERPESMQALAELVGRKQSNLSRTLRKLEQAGIVRLDPGPRRTLAPRLLARRVTLDLDLVTKTGSMSVSSSAS